MLSRLGRTARVSDEVEVGPLALGVVEVDGNRIKTLRARVDPSRHGAQGR